MPTLSINRHLSAPPAAIWRCWTEPALLKEWFTPAPVQTTEAQINPTPGGIFQVTMLIPEMGEMALPAGCFLHAEPPHRLVWTNTLGPEYRPVAMGSGPTDFPFTAEIRLTPEGTGTRYVATVTHATEADRDKHAAMGFEEGWGQATTQLETLAATL